MIVSGATVQKPISPIEIEKAINNNLDYVKSETLANAIQFNVQQEGGHEIFFEKLKTKIFITKV